MIFQWSLKVLTKILKILEEMFERYSWRSSVGSSKVLINIFWDLSKIFASWRVDPQLLILNLSKLWGSRLESIFRFIMKSNQEISKWSFKAFETNKEKEFNAIDFSHHLKLLSLLYFMWINSLPYSLCQCLASLTLPQQYGTTSSSLSTTSPLNYEWTLLSQLPLI